MLREAGGLRGGRIVQGGPEAARQGESLRTEAGARGDFHEYRHMERFIGTVQDAGASGQLWRAIKGKGAFRHFKDIAARRGVLAAWFRHREDAMRKFVIEWAAETSVPYEDNAKARKP